MRLTPYRKHVLRRVQRDPHLDLIIIDDDWFLTSIHLKDADMYNHCVRSCSCSDINRKPCSWDGKALPPGVEIDNEVAP